MEGKLNKQINKSKKVNKIKQDLEISGYQLLRYRNEQKFLV